MATLSVYIHFPFCLSKCIYCDFNSSALRGRESNGRTIDEYADFICREVDLRMKGNSMEEVSVESIYFGGGTPSLMSLSNIENILNKISGAVSISSHCEITLECNPATLKKEKLVALKKTGINRLSVGCQSFNDSELKFLGRIHNAEDNFRIIRDAEEAGFDNISLDIIFAVPDSTLRSFKETLRKTLSLPVTHISCYGLTVEEETPLFKKVQTGEIVPAGDETQREMYLTAVDLLNSQGFKQYEISNFSKEGFQCRHNLNYWNGGNYLGVGVSAHSCEVFRNDAGQYESVKRIWNTRDLNEYFDLLKSQKPPQEGEETLKGDKLLSEAIMLGLRKTEGISLQAFNKKYDVDIKIRYLDEIKRLCDGGLILADNDNLRLTAEGLLLSNEVFQAFF